MTKTNWPCDTGDCYADAHGGCDKPCPLNQEQLSTYTQVSTVPSWPWPEPGGIW